VAKLISVVSGKGGTGKSLLTAVLGRAIAREGVSVLIIDFDVFVRGLTILLTESGRRPLQVQGFTVSDLLEESFHGSEVAAISRFFECDVLPAVKDIGAPFQFGEIEQGSLERSRELVGRLIKMLPLDKYDLVLFDNRAGLDALFLACCEVADVVLAVAEDDDVALQTNANLINSLRFSHRIRSAVYTVINKGRRIYSYEDLKTSSFRQVEFNYVGVIPFDSEVMEDFGT